jgi:putative nucleotidyltransferase with HDIG domain
MSDQKSELLNRSELKFARKQSFFDRSRTVTWGIGFLFAAGLFLLLHFREVKIETLEVNNIAPSYIVAQHETDFFDAEATFILRQEAVKEVGKIFLLSEVQVRERKLEFENFLLYHQDWGKYAGTQAFEEMFNGLDRVEKTLLSLRFTDPRTLQKMKDVGISTQYYLIYTPADLEESNTLPSQIWDQVAKLTFGQTMNPESPEHFVLAYMMNQKWLIEEDIPTQKILRKEIQAKVPDKYTHVPAGSRIIDQGEKITPRHIAMYEALKQAMRENRRLSSPGTLLGSLIMSLLLTIVCAAYFKINHPQILHSNRKLFLLVAIIMITIGIAKATETFIINGNTPLYDVVHYPLFVPFAAILVSSLINGMVATFVAGFLTILLTMTLIFDPQGFMIMNLAAGVAAILTTRSLRRRKEIFVVCGKAWLITSLVDVSLHLYDNTFWHFAVISDILSSGVFLLLTAVLVVGFMPLLETSFRVMTDAALMEYMDPNNDLLRRMSIEASGTYQHSVVMGNLAEAAANAIGANGLFCRVATLYHDIGKMATPQYFTENQTPDANVHLLLTPLESAQVILAHVPEGVSLAQKAGLPEQFIDIIREHHGTTLVYYFYRKQLDLMGGNKNLVNEADFRYAGPTPRSKESAIIMIADSVEAASRSLEKINEETLTELVSRLIREKMDEGQFDECLLTFEELAIVKAALIKSLIAFGHSRVRYPKRETESQGIFQNA